jgi:hypothetical protein
LLDPPLRAGAKLRLPTRLINSLNLTCLFWILEQSLSRQMGSTLNLPDQLEIEEQSYVAVDAPLCRTPNGSAIQNRGTSDRTWATSTAAAREIAHSRLIASLDPEPLCYAITRSRERGHQHIFVMQTTQHRSGAHPEALADPMAS